MILRTLTADEFPLLRDVHEGFMPDPQSSTAIVAEDGGRVIGRIFLVAPVHIEGPWIDEAHRGGMLLARLVARAEAEARRCGLTSLFAYGATPATEGYLARLGFAQKPLTVWAKEL